MSRNLKHLLALANDHGYPWVGGLISGNRALQWEIPDLIEHFNGKIIYMLRGHKLDCIPILGIIGRWPGHQ